jgi:Transcriptional regulator
LIFEDLSAFVAVARHGSFARAAVDLCIAQSALSKRVQRLEQRVGVPLLERRARGVALTEVGQVFLARAERVVAEVADMERNLSAVTHTPSGEVRVAMPQRSCALLAPPLIERCRAELPLVDLQVLEGTPAHVHAWLLSGEADIALAYNPELGAEFWIKPVLVEPLYLFGASPAVARKRGTPLPEVCSLSDLANYPLILPKKPHSIRVLIDRLCAGHGVRPNIIYEAEGTHTIRGMVERGMGYTVFSKSGWKYAVDSGALAVAPFSSPLVNWRLCIVRHRKDISAVAVNRVNEILEQELDALVVSGAWPYARRAAE